MTMEQEIIQKLTQLHNEGKLKWERAYWQTRPFSSPEWEKDTLMCHVSQDMTIWLDNRGAVYEVEYVFLNTKEHKYRRAGEIVGYNNEGAELYKAAETQSLADLEKACILEDQKGYDKRQQKQAAFLKELETL